MLRPLMRRFSGSESGSFTQMLDKKKIPPVWKLRPEEFMFMS